MRKPEVVVVTLQKDERVVVTLQLACKNQQQAWLHYKKPEAVVLCRLKIGNVGNVTNVTNFDGGVTGPRHIVLSTGGTEKG